MARKLGKEDEASIRRKVELLQAIHAEHVLTEECERSLKTFLKQCWPTLSPGVPFHEAWHIDCICDHLEALSRREIRRLIINISPRSLKSTIISVVFPAWRWLNEPSEKFLCASYGKNIAIRDSRRTRNLIASQWYQVRWNSRYALAADQNEKGRFENTKGGFRIIASVEGGILGEGGSISVYDDANDLNKMPSPIYEQEVRDWYSNSASSRFIDPKTDVRICVQQRAPYGNDLTAYLLELGGWEHLPIPNEWEGSRKTTSIGWGDPRTRLGELMDPGRLGPEETEVLKREQKANYQGQYQQRPITGGTDSLRREWFKFYNPRGMNRVDETGKPIPVRITATDGNTVEVLPVELPEAFEQVVQSWDMAFKDQEKNDFVAGHAWSRLGANCYLLARSHGHRNFPETLAEVRKMSTAFACPEKLVEDKANGPAVLDMLKNEIPGLIPVDPAGGKLSRVAAISGYVESGNVYLPNPDLFPWVWDLLSEFAAGRTAKHDDDTDAMTQALKRLYDSMSRTGVPEFRVQPRLGEPRTACHVSKDRIPATWRRMMAVDPGRACLEMAETPSGSLRVIREMSLNRVDAAEAGRKIAEAAYPTLLARQGANVGWEILFPKSAFAKIEPIGCYAELLEASLLAWEPEKAALEERRSAPGLLRAAKFRAEMVEEDPAALDRLRSLLSFAPPDFAPEPYDRQKALRLADEDLAKYQDYMAAVDGEVRGEWPKLKISPECPQLIAELGAFRTDLDPPPFVSALLIGVSAPLRWKPRELGVVPINQQHGSGGLRNQRLLRKRFAFG